MRREAVANLSAKGLVSCILALLVVGTGSLVAGATQTTHRTAPVTPLAASTSLTKVPSNLVPALSSFTDHLAVFKLGGTSEYSSCDPYNSVARTVNPTPCFFGNLNGSKTIVLTGDSNVGNWIPALNAGLANTDYRLAVFPYSGCPTSDITYNSSTAFTNAAQCNTWHKNVTAKIAALHPVAVMADSGAVDLGKVPNDKWVSGFTTLFSQSTHGSPQTKRILIGTSPMLAQPAPTCLSVHPNPKVCGLTYTYGKPGYGAYLARDSKIASVTHARLVPTHQFVCNGSHCSPVVGNYLVYTDTDHLTIAYSQSIAAPVTAAVLAAVTAQHSTTTTLKKSASKAK